MIFPAISHFTQSGSITHLEYPRLRKRLRFRKHPSFPPEDKVFTHATVRKSGVYGCSVPGECYPCFICNPLRSVTDSFSPNRMLPTWGGSRNRFGRFRGVSGPKSRTILDYIIEFLPYPISHLHKKRGLEPILQVYLYKSATKLESGPDRNSISLGY